jgi:cell division protein ZapA (FtsZ GTPase activity inhibitor)
MQQLELDLNRSQQDDETTAKDVDESLLVLRGAANRLGPDAETRVTLRKQEGALRELASRAEVHSLPEIRKTAGYFEQKTSELHALNRSIEETRMGLMTQIDLLQELKVQLEFNRAAGQIGDLLKRGEGSLNSIQVIAAHAQQLANDLADFGSTPAPAAQFADGINPGQATKTPAPVAKPAAGYGRASRRPPAADAPALVAAPGNTLRAEPAAAASASATQAPNRKETAPGFILLPSGSPAPAIASAHRTVAPSSPKPAAANPPPTTR